MSNDLDDIDIFLLDMYSGDNFFELASFIAEYIEAQLEITLKQNSSTEIVDHFNLVVNHEKVLLNGVKNKISGDIVKSLEHLGEVVISAPPSDHLIISRASLALLKKQVLDKKYTGVLGSVFELMYIVNSIKKHGKSLNDESIIKSFKTQIAKENANKRLENDSIQLAKNQIEQEYWQQKDQFKRRGYSAQFKREMSEKYPEITDIKTIERLITKLNKKNDDYPSS